jgi:hypothetical protein
MLEYEHTCKQAGTLFFPWCGVGFRSDEMYIFFSFVCEAIAFCFDDE